MSGGGSGTAARPQAGPIVGERFDGRWHDGRADYGEEGRPFAGRGAGRHPVGYDHQRLGRAEGAIRGRIDRASGAVEFRFAWRSARGTSLPCAAVCGPAVARRAPAPVSGALTMTTSVGATYAEAEADLKPGRVPPSSPSRSPRVEKARRADRYTYGYTTLRNAARTRSRIVDASHLADDPSPSSSRRRESVRRSRGAGCRRSRGRGAARPLAALFCAVAWSPVSRPARRASPSRRRAPPIRARA
jgi:hypothetical protein